MSEERTLVPRLDRVHITRGGPTLGYVTSCYLCQNDSNLEMNGDLLIMAIVFIPTLVALLEVKEKESSRELTWHEVESIRDNATTIDLPTEIAIDMTKRVPEALNTFGLLKN